ncbi:pre-mRNA-processing factor 31 [Trichomonascus vanleenenianus]|uniref:U4/U6-U5 snRNP complex subunit PRP31 n=1 Tax=Trichomonascus vanleenenianus TaxID=2268995 RepID=UPI003ECB502E
MSLADELLADLGSDEEINEVENGIVTDGDKITENLEESSSAEQLLQKLTPVLANIREDRLDSVDVGSSSFESHPSYQLLVQANDFSVDIDNEIILLHGYAKELYAKRFDSLAQCVPRATEYARAVKIIGNDLRNIDHQQLQEFLSKSEIMNISMTAYQSTGKPLGGDELKRLYDMSDVILALADAKREITDFVSSRLTVFAPNLTRIVSSHVVAQLMGFAGGLQGLSCIPNSNMPALGAKQIAGVSFGQKTIRKQGFLYYSELIQSVPEDKRVQAMRIVSGKIVLAARVDLQHSGTDGSLGAKWRKEIDEKLDKLVEPPETKGPKALPIPEDKKSKKRGGKRMRKLKERLGQTELQKAQNRMTFGQSAGEYGDDEDETPISAAKMVTFGRMKPTKAADHSKARMSKSMKERLANATANATSGIATSLSFTPVQGIELLAPKKQSSNLVDDKWFSSGTFTTVAEQKGFTVPTKRKAMEEEQALPNKRQK